MQTNRVLKFLILVFLLIFVINVVNTVDFVFHSFDGQALHAFYKHGSSDLITNPNRASNRWQQPDPVQRVCAFLLSNHILGSKNDIFNPFA